MTGQLLQNYGQNKTIDKEESTGAFRAGLSDIANNVQALHGWLLIAGEGFSHGGERWQECRSQGDTKQNGFVFGA